MTEQIKIENADNILTLTFVRPDKKNALTNVMYGALADAIVAAETDQAVRAIVIRGEGDMFTAGNDVGEFAAIATGAFKGERHVARFSSALAHPWSLRSRAAPSASARRCCYIAISSCLPKMPSS
jgi:enoyl-CoA hydratase/carnithine racemase